MTSEFLTDSAFELGNQAVAELASRGEELCKCERATIELANEVETTKCKARLKILCDERFDVRAIVHSIPLPEPAARQRRMYFIVSALLIGLSSFAVNHLALSPFGLGLYALPAAIGLSMACVTLTDFVLERYGNNRVIGGLAISAFLASVVGLLILGLLRGDIVTLYLKTAIAGAAPNDEGATAINLTDATAFYESSARTLRFLFALLAIAMELATGLLVWQARRINLAPEAMVAKARQRLSEIEQDMVELVGRIVALENAPAVFAGRFMREFYRGVLEGAKKNGLAHLGNVLGIAFMLLTLSQVIFAQPAQPIVGVTVDLSVSSDKGAYEKNAAAAAQVISHLAPATKFTVLGITQESFSRPLILLSGQLPVDSGELAFVDRVANARNNYATELRKLLQSTKPAARQTDVFGSLLINSDMFRTSPSSRRVLIILSDMRNSTAPLDIESPRVISVASALAIARKQHLIADLHGVEVWVLGVHSIGKDIVYADSLATFWREYFRLSGASLRAFSLMRDVPDLARTR